MTLTIDLPSDLESTVRQQAARRGQDVLLDQPLLRRRLSDRSLACRRCLGRRRVRDGLGRR